MALTMAATNDEMKQLYHYLKTREKSPLRKMQALIVVSKKILTLIYTLAKKKESYDPRKSSDLSAGTAKSGCLTIKRADNGTGQTCAVVLPLCG